MNKIKGWLSFKAWQQTLDDCNPCMEKLTLQGRAPLPDAECMVKLKVLMIAALVGGLVFGFFAGLMV